MNADQNITVLVVEDEGIVAEAHAEYVRRSPGFALAGVVHTGTDAITFLNASRSGSGADGGRAAHTRDTPEPAVDLILLDMNLPDLHGLDVLRRIRGAGVPADVIAITAVRDLAVVRSAMSAGIAQYLIKPFTFSAFSAKLASYREFHRNLAGQGVSATQSEVDRALAALRPNVPAVLPKGLSPDTLKAVSELLKTAPAPLSASEVSAALTMSRITVRRYLEHLDDQRAVLRTPRYGTRGRPELEYSWRR
ncbi:response regulator [Arthrobacter gengyunqii]|uniref:Transcriptional regulatory protein n=1 Tax=Arthrobacter gengyunqii TaxID=2886940 RepID=A0A9X1S6J3_9MICC|nr:response regulator [Arthrobacter gengyunqii]MCC3264457.1 response regulator [Arthrobacter gengyunqii]MCC3270610.1 response regulator [Arthrobacter gengyunqii]UOY97348.1 response regulator [Arthrobacter gengyunqii]